MSGLEKKIEQMKSHATKNGYAHVVRELMEKNGLPLFEALASARAAWDMLHEEKTETPALSETQVSDFRSDVYTALTDVMYQYSKRDIAVTKSEMQAAFDQFCTKFWAD